MLADCFIAKAEYVNDYKLLIVFEDGQKRVADFYTFMSKCKLPCVKKFLDIDLFKQFRIEDGTVCWGDNEMDFNPLDIYCGFFEASDSPYKNDVRNAKKRVKTQRFLLKREI